MRTPNSTTPTPNLVFNTRCQSAPARCTRSLLLYMRRQPDSPCPKTGCRCACSRTAAAAPPAPQGWGGGGGRQDTECMKDWDNLWAQIDIRTWKRLTGIKLSNVGRLTYNSRRRRGSKLIWSWKLTRRRRLIWSRRVTRHRRLARSRRLTRRRRLTWGKKLTRRRRLTWSRRVTRRRRPAWTCWSRRVTRSTSQVDGRQEGDTTSEADLYQQAAWEDLKH